LQTQRQRIADTHRFPPCIVLVANTARPKIDPVRRQSSGSGLNLPQTYLSESSQKIADQHDHKDGAKPNAGASACAPPAIAEVPSAAAENQQQNNNQNDQHLAFPFTPGIPGLWIWFDCAERFRLGNSPMGASTKPYSLNLNRLRRVLDHLFRLSEGFHGVFQGLPCQLLRGCVIARAMNVGSGCMCVGRLAVQFCYMGLRVPCHFLLLIVAGSHCSYIQSFLCCAAKSCAI
jgi:hypothetical protein